MKATPTISIPTPGLLLRGVLLAAAMFACLAGSRAAVLPPDAVFEGRTLGEWNAEAWKWIYSVPGSKSPSMDCDGQWANENQPGGSVFFIAPMSGEGPLPCARTFTVPANKHLLVPVLPITIDNIDTLPPLEIEQMYDALDSVAAIPEDIFASIDGVAVTNLLQYRATSPPFSFYFRDVDNHISAFYKKPVVGLLDPMVVDGYWLLLEPLTPGPHVLRTGGRFHDFFEHEIVANIMVAPANHPPIADASATRTRVVSVDRAGVSVVLDGSRSSDPDNDKLTFRWTEQGTTIGSGAIVTRRFQPGFHSITLTVSDGSLKATNSIVIQVIAADQAIEDLIRTVKNLSLPRNDTRTLTLELAAALRAVERDKPQLAVRHLETFQREVNLRLTGRDAAITKRLHRSAQEVIKALEGRSK